MGSALDERMERAAARAARREQARERLIFGVPSRLMIPRIVLALTTAGLVAFGMLMIYSASSITAMSDGLGAGYYVVRQLVACAVGLVALAILVFTDYHVWGRHLLPALWVAVMVLLLIVRLGGEEEAVYGATRWVQIGSFSLQPSEFAKVVVILTASYVAMRYFEEHTIVGFPSFVGYMAVGVLLPLVLILIQPDKGTTIICAVTLLVMAYLAGMARPIIFGLGLVAVGLGLFLSLKDDYSRQRILTMLNPWRDEYDTGYQLIQGFYAFAQGGLFGVGLGMSRQKYYYLPMAHNDFIFAVIGEELGLVGTVCTLCGFLAFMWAGLRIARYAPDLMGRLIAAGCTSLIMIQLFVNVLGVLGVIPLTGKPVPFISYGGSSIVSCLLLVGFIGSVARASVLPDTVFDARRRSYGVAREDDYEEGPGFALVGEATPRSQRQASAPVDRGFSVVGGGRARSASSVLADASRGLRDTSPEALRASRDLETRLGGRVSVDTSGRRRVDLGPDAATRLRSSRGGSGRR